jgi:hypothetical protein
MSFIERILEVRKLVAKTKTKKQNETKGENL